MKMVMIVDDEQEMQELFEMVFYEERQKKRIGFIFALSGEEALALLEENSEMNIASILSDINMPGMDGLELLQKLKSSHPDLQVLMMTAYNDLENRKKAEEYGADGYFSKPMDFVALKKQLIG